MPTPANRPLLGTTYNYKHIDYLKLDRKSSFQQLLNFNFDIVRLCTYWSELEPQPKKYDFSVMERMLEECEKKNQSVVIVVGMKTPRWPEFHFPQWLKKPTPETASPYLFDYLFQLINRLKSYSCIKYWQVENEPLDPSGPNRFSIPLVTLEKEVEIIKSITPLKPILTTLWGNELVPRKLYPLLIPISNIIGLDLYYKISWKNIITWGPFNTDKQIKTIIDSLSQDIWITELQAEPWEGRFGDNFSQETKTMSGEILENNFQRALQLKPKAILFWGFEYWLWRKIKGNEDLWKKAKEIVSKLI